MGRRIAASLAALAAVAVGCKRDVGRLRAEPPEHERAVSGALKYLPRGALLVATTADPAGLTERLGWPGLLEADTAMRAELSSFTREYAGIDVVELQRWGEFGIDLAAPAGVVLYPGEGPRVVFFVELEDPYRFQEYLHESAARWMGPIDSRTEGRALVVTGRHEEVGIVVRGRHAFAVLTPEADERDPLLARIASQAEAESLAAEPEVGRATRSEGDLVVYAAFHHTAAFAKRHVDQPEEAALIERLLAPLGGVILAVRFGGEEIGMRLTGEPPADSLPHRLLGGRRALEPPEAQETSLFISIAAEPRALVEVAELIARALAPRWHSIGAAALTRALLTDLDGGAALAAFGAETWWFGLGSGRAGVVAERLGTVLPIRRTQPTRGGAWLLLSGGDRSPPNDGMGLSWRRSADSVAVFSLWPAAFIADSESDIGAEPLPAEVRDRTEPTLVELVRRHDALEQELALAEASFRKESERYAQQFARRTGHLRLRARRDGVKVIVEGGLVELPGGARGALAALFEELLQLRTRDRTRYEQARDKLWDVQSQLWSLRHELDAAVTALERAPESVL